MHGWSHRPAVTRAGFAACALSAVTVLAGAGGALAAGPVWKLVPSANATLSGGKLQSVSCSSAAACTAVGTDLNTSGINVTLAERWNGTSWQRQPTPNPAEDTAPAVDPELLGVSCPAADFCEAVGTYQLGGVGLGLAETWNGRHWKLQPFPFSGSPVQVSCTSSQFCEAVGYSDRFGGTLPFAATWNGSSWQVQHPPNPAGSTSDQLNAVSCTSPVFCEAWGVPGLAEQWNGKSWRLQAVPSGATADSVSCVSATFCEAAGLGAAFAWNGSQWSEQTTPTAGSSPLSLDGVSCTSATFCEAVGSYFGNAGDVVTAAVWDGSAWQLQSPPNPGGVFNALHAVSCTSASSCEAVGAFQLTMTFNDPKALAEQWNGHSWQAQQAIAPPGAAYNKLAAVSCISASFCEAAGTHVNSSGNDAGLAEQWNGTSWNLQAVPSPPSTFGNPRTETLVGVSCVSASFCMAVGSGTAGAYTEMWNGTSWKLQSVPVPSLQFTAVSCTAVSFCMAAGTNGGVAIWHGSSWSAGPDVPGFSPLTGLSCVSASYCEVVGSGPSGQDAAAWNGSSWSAQSTSGPANAGLSAVSCSAANACEAVGTLFGQTDATFAEAWNGSAWTTQSTPNPQASQGSLLNSVSCTSAGACTAVGQYQSSNLGFLRTLAEVWNGQTWSLRSTPNHLNAGQNLLNGVSCGAVGVCTAVGQTQDAGEVEATLIEAGD